MSIGPFLQADINMSLRCVHKTEEKKQENKKHMEAPQTQPEKAETLN